ncbi:MAG: adenylate kinase [Candidatus Adiutrix intracellularis]|jgi:adenylate kinase|nr:adenylate kinase [Candidatus Adiutrix intracellularis]
MIIILLGPPGAGKGTQAGAIAEKFGLPHVSTGDIFRANLKEGTPLGMEAKKYMDSGGLVPDELVLRLVNDRLNAPDAVPGALLDGFPRTAAQAEALANALVMQDRRVDHCVCLTVPDEILLKRLAGRCLCRQCGAGYHVDFSPPPPDGRCGSCGGEIYQRDDDQAATVKNRLLVYHQQTSPLIQWYDDSGVLRVVDGQGSVNEVKNRILSALEQGS